MKSPEFLTRHVLQVALVYQLAEELWHDVSVAFKRIIHVDLRHGFRDGVLADVTDDLLVLIVFVDLSGKE